MMIINQIKDLEWELKIKRRNVKELKEIKKKRKKNKIEKKC